MSEMQYMKPEMRCMMPEMQCMKSEIQCIKPEFRCMKPEMQCMKSEMQCMKPEMQCMKPEFRCIKPEMQCMSYMKPVCEVSPKKYRIMCEEVGFIPHTIKTCVNGNMLQVVGLVEMKVESGVYVTKEFKRMYELPRGVCVEQMMTLFTEYGQLIIEMPMLECETYPVDCDRMRGMKISTDKPAMCDETADNVYFTVNMLVKDEEKKMPMFKSMYMPSYYKCNKTVMPETMTTRYMCDEEKMRMTMGSPMTMDKCMDYKQYKGCGF